MNDFLYKNRKKLKNKQKKNGGKWKQKKNHPLENFTGC